MAGENIQGIASHRQNQKLVQEKPNLAKVFTSDEIGILKTFLAPIKFIIIIVALSTFLIASLEGARSIAVVGFCKAIAPSSDSGTGDSEFSIFGYSMQFASPGTPKDEIVARMFFLVLAISFGVALCQLISAYLSKRSQLSLTRSIREAVLRKIFSFDLSTLHKARSGEFVFLLTQETNRFSQMIPFISGLLQVSLESIFYLALLFSMFWDLTIILLAASAVIMAIYTILSTRLKPISFDIASRFANMSHIAQQILYGMKVLKIGSLEKREINHFLKNHRYYERGDIKLTLTMGFLQFGLEIGFFMVLALLSFSVYYLDKSEALVSNPGAILGYLFLAYRLMSVLKRANTLRSNIISAYGPLARVMSLLKQPDGPWDIDANDAAAQPASTGFKPDSIEAQGVFFDYPDRTRALDGVSLTVNGNSITALVGASGSGKSTFLDIVSGLYPPSDGKILVNGASLAGERFTQYRHSISYLNQDPILFHDSVRANVTYFMPESTEEEIWDALRFACIDTFVSGLPDRLDTPLGERGQAVSGGERQRLGLARVLLQRKPIILLDEATNALDYETESRIYRNLNNIKSERLILIAAHRLAALKDFDHIACFNEGKIVETGTHEELLAEEGVYYRLYTSKI